MKKKRILNRVVAYTALVFLALFTLSFSASTVQGGTVQAPKTDSADLALDIALDYLVQNQAQFGLSSADLANPIVTDFV